MLRPYSRVLRTPGILLPFLATFAGSLSIGMLGLAILLFAHARTGSLGVAGVIAGLYSAGNALGLVVQGRFIDRRGQTVVLVPAAVLSATALLVLVLGPAAPVAIGLCALIAGVCVPATITAMRTLIPEILPDEQRRTTAYATLAVLFSVATLLGSLVVSGLLTLVGSTGAILVGGGLASGGGLAFAGTPASRAWKPPRRHATGGRLIERGMRTLLVSAAGLGFCSGLTGIGIPALAIDRGAASLAALFFAVASIGDLLSGFGYGIRHWKMPKTNQLIFALCAASVVALCVASATQSLTLLFPLLFLGGAVGAPAGIATSALLDGVARRGAITQSYAALVCVGLLSGSAGNALGGVLADAAGTRLLFLANGLGLAAVAGWTYLRRRTLVERKLLTSA